MASQHGRNRLVAQIPRIQLLAPSLRPLPSDHWVNSFMRKVRKPIALMIVARPKAMETR